MNAPWALILMVAAFVFFLISAVAWVPPVEPWRNRMIAAGLACWTLALIIGKG